MYYKILHLGNTSALFAYFLLFFDKFARLLSERPWVHGSLRSPLQVAISDCSPLWLKTCHRHVFLTRRARRERQKAPRIRSFLSRRKARVCDHCRSPFYRLYVIHIVPFLCRSRRFRPCDARRTAGLSRAGSSLFCRFTIRTEEL